MAPQTDTHGTSGTSRSRRLRRVLVTGAAAAVVILVPTACSAAVAQDRIPTTAGHDHTAQAVATATPPTQTGSSASTAPSGSAQPGQSGSGQSGSGSGQGGSGQYGNQGQNNQGNQNPGAQNPDSQNPGTQNPQGTPSAPATPGKAPATSTATPPASNSTAPTPAAPAKPNNGLDVLARDCSKSTLPPHDGFQQGDRCVSTAFGEVGTAAQNPSLLITDSPDKVGVGQTFQIKVSTRNLIRDRFLGAAQGGYYLESSLLQNGIQRGHFHTACRMLSSTSVAPDPSPAPAFFLATQDNKGSATPDTVTIEVPGLKQTGIAQCAVWAGDGSHRIPMMERANQIPAFDSVRITVS